MTELETTKPKLLHPWNCAAQITLGGGATLEVPFQIRVCDEWDQTPRRVVDTAWSMFAAHKLKAGETLLAVCVRKADQ
jgi:hypothetical protein